LTVFDWFKGLHPVVQALLATCFTWFMTALGAAVVFTARELSRKTLDGMLGFAAGVMIAASYWSLLAPAIEMSEGKDFPAWVPAVVGFLVGAFSLRLVDGLLLISISGCRLNKQRASKPAGADHSFGAGHNLAQYSRGSCGWGRFWSVGSRAARSYPGRSCCFGNWDRYTEFS